MGQAYSPHDRQDSTQAGLDGSPLNCGDEHADDVVSVLEENARLRSLVVKLSEIILRNVVN
jgi:hypothetical protein